MILIYLIVASISAQVANISRMRMVPPNITSQGRPRVILPTVDVGRGVSDWPLRIVAPYIYISPWGPYDIDSNRANTGAKLWSLAFIIADGNGNPSWGGSDSITNSFYSNYIGKVRAAGGDVIISFGGGYGSEIALVTWDLNSLVYKYQQVIDQYAATYIDIDVEGNAAGDQRSIDLRSQAIKVLQNNNPGLKVSLTIAATTSGLDWGGVNIIQSALNAGVQLYMVNIMAMDFGPCNLNMGQTVINSASGTYNQLQSMGMWSKVGVTAMIGVNDISCEVFGLDDARYFISWAAQQSYIGLVSFWSAARDTSRWGDLPYSTQISQNEFQFTGIFMGFASSSSQVVQAGVVDYADCVNSCRTSTFQCCTAKADVISGKKTCRPSSDCYTAVADYSTCASGDICQTATFKCCTAKSDFATNKNTCRPPADCYTGIQDLQSCAAGDTCQSAGFSCCTTRADFASKKTTCQAASNCYSGVSNWETCQTGDICQTAGFQCCTAAADLATGKKTCRTPDQCATSKPVTTTSSSMSYPTPILPDKNYKSGYNWGPLVFSPIVDISGKPNYDFIAHSKSVGSVRYTLSNVQSKATVPSWDGVTALSTQYLSSIQSLRLFGGDVCIRFGGSGIDLSSSVTSSKQLQIDYQNVIDAYSASCIDIFLSTLDLSNKSLVKFRFQTLRLLQLANPNTRLIVSLPVNPQQGFSADGLDGLRAAMEAGVRIDVLNVLAYNFGSDTAPNAATASGSYVIQAATSAKAQAQGMGLSSSLGITVMIGKSDVGSGVFSQADGIQLVKWAKTSKFVSLLSFDATRDEPGLSGISQKKYEFSSIFVQFEN